MSHDQNYNHCVIIFTIFYDSKFSGNSATMVVNSLTLTVSISFFSNPTPIPLDCSIYPGKFANTVTENIIDKNFKNNLQEWADWCQEEVTCKILTFKIDEQMEAICWLISSYDAPACPSTNCTDIK